MTKPMFKTLPSDLDIARFASKTTPHHSGCLLWTGMKNKDNYGRFRVGRSLELAHRVAFTIANGRWPTMPVLHSCDVPSCVCPTHLSEGTMAENVRQMHERGRSNFRGMAKLCTEDVKSIRALVANGASQRSISVEFGVCQSAISLIVTRRTWSHV